MSSAIFPALECLWLAAGALCLAVAGLLAAGRTEPARLERRLKKVGRAAVIALPLLLILLKLAQLRAFQLMLDSAIMGNVLWNAAHGHGLTSSILGGQSYLSVHFAFVLFLLAPLVRLWPSMVVPIVAHSAIVAAAALLVPPLARRLDLRPLSGALLALLLVASPMFHELSIAVLDNAIYAPALFLGACLLWLSGRKGPAVLCGMLFLATREQACFVLFGWALFELSRRHRARALSLGLAGVALFAVELAVITHAKSSLAAPVDNWRLYSALGGSQSAILSNALRRPWLFAVALVYPPEKLLAALRVLGPFLFLPLLSGAAFFVPAALWLPQQLADAGAFFHQAVGGHYGALLLGPLVLTAALGLRRLESSRRYPVIAALLLATAGIDFLQSARFVPPASFPASWPDELAAVQPLVPADASIWCDEYLAPHFAMRRFIKALPRSDDPNFDSGFFAPDRVILSRQWLARADPALLKRIFDFLGARGYVKLLNGRDIVVLGAK